MKTWLGALLVSALAVACSAPADSSTTANADTTTPPPAAADPDWEVFATRADAEAFIHQHLDDIFGVAPLPATDARTIRAQAALDRHWPAIVAKFHPTYPEPIVFVVDDDKTVNAEALFDWHTDQAMNMIYVYSGLMKFSDSDLETTLLHETGHLMTKNGIQRYADALTKYYQADPNAEGVGIAIPNNPDTQAFVTPYDNNLLLIGDTDVAEMDGVLVDPSAGMTFFFNKYATDHNDPSNPDCTTLSTEVDKTNAILAAASTPYDYAIRLTPDQSTALSDAAKTIEATAITCLKPPANLDLDAVFGQTFGFPAGGFAQAHPDLAPLWAGKDALTGLFAMTRDLYAKDRAFEAAPAYKQLREYTNEEQADDFALTMLAFEANGFSAMRTQFLDFIPSDADRAQCSAMLAQGVVPPYSLLNAHHGNCYRAFHVGQFEKYAANGGEGVVIPTIPKPAVTATAARKHGPLEPKAWKNSTF